jgi:hypothetical protein
MANLVKLVFLSLNSLSFYLSYQSIMNISLVKGELLDILGKIAHYYPDQMLRLASPLLSIYLDLLDIQFKSSKPDMMIISGTLNGLHGLLFKFSGDFVACLFLIHFFHSLLHYLIDFNSIQF